MLTRSDSSAPAVDDATGELRVPIAISSEEPFQRWFGTEVLGHEPGEIVTTYLDRGMALLYAHDDDETPCGRIENWTIGSDRVLRGDAVFDAGDPVAVMHYGKVVRGFLPFVSVGYRVQEYVLAQWNEETGESTYRAVKWTPMEASFVAVPADVSVGANRSAHGGVVAVPVRSPVPLPIRSASVPPENAPAAVSAAAPAPPASQPDTRAYELAELATISGRTGGELAAWLLSGRSVADVRAEVMSAIRAASTAAAPAAATAVIVGEQRELKKPFNNLGEQLRAVKNACITGGVTDPRLLELNRAVPTGLGEAVGADGGFLIAPQFAAGIEKIVFEGGEIISRVNRIPMSGNQYIMQLVDETSRTNGNRWGGVRGYRIGENDPPTKTKPKFRRVTLDTTKKIAVLAYVTEEQLEDAPATSTILEQAFGEELTFVAEDEVWEGGGSGQMLGVINSGALITQAAEGGQVATTINAQNVVKMWSRLLRTCRKNAVWFINQDAEPQLPLMTIANLPVYLPPGGLSESMYGRLFGRPVIPIEFASTLGAVGDIVLADLSWYAVGEKAGQTMQRSMHVRFEQGEEAFRLIWRVDGSPMLASPITPFKGTNTQSAFVALAAR